MEGRAHGQTVDLADCYVLYRAPGTARYPFLAAWIARHRLSAGFRPGHAARFRRVLVVGPPDGLALPPSCQVAYVQAEGAEARFAADPPPDGFF
jgi:hypothetical protein